MDEDESSTSVPIASNYNRLPSESIFTDTLPIFVNNEWGSSTTQGVQLCPAIFLASCQNIPQAVKHVYSRLASSSSEVDQGIPELLLSLVATGTHSFNFEDSERLVKGFGKIITRCGFWAITSGEQNDPLAAAVAAALRCTLPQQGNSSEETLVIAVNSMDVAYQAAVHSKAPAMTDSRYNTFYMVLNKTGVPENEMLRFRTCASVNLANPPPALLIGVPDERSSSQQSQKYSHSSSQTPIGSTAPAIILPSSIVSVETRPLPMVLFCASSLASLLDLQHYLQCGVPVLVIHDCSVLCNLLHTSFTFHQSAGFKHSRFVDWLDEELRKIVVSTNGSCKKQELEEAKTAICHILMSTSKHHALLSFTSSEDLENLQDHLLKLLVRSATDSADHVRIVHLAVKLNSASVINTVKLESIIAEEQLESLLEEALATDDHMEVLGALLDQSVPIRISSNLLLNWLENTSDQYFFNTIILGHFLGLSYKLEKINEYTANCINDLLCKLSGGISSLFPPEYFVRPLGTFERGKGIQVLALWALLLNRIEVVKLLCAYSQEPIALCLVLAKISRNLARLSREWFFYEQRLIGLSNYLNSTAVYLLDAAYRECPVKAYQALCRQLGSFNQLTLSQLAFETNAREFIAHECCQRWVLRLLYGDLQLRSLSTSPRLPNWLKIVLASVLVVPTLFWVSVRPSTVANAKRETWSRPVSPTVALLEDGRQVKKVRASSTYSMHSMRSGYVHDAMSITGYNTIHPQNQDYNQYGTVEPDTPNSANQAMAMDDADLFLPQNNVYRSSPSNFMPRNNYRAVSQFKPRRNKERTVGLSLFSMFYSTPITKYWLSLTFRLLYLCLLAFSVALPGCGYLELDFALWLWALMWLIEGLWVLNIRMDNCSWREMPWTIFDVCCVSVFLLFLLSVRIAGTYLPKMVQSNSFAYTQKAVWSMFLLYECYKTLFIYIPLSDVLGPLLVRIKLMITRDFVNFIILVLLVVFSSAFAIKALVFPDLGLSASTAGESLGWAISALFTTDLTLMKESEQCHRMLLPHQRANQCKGIGGYADPRCPTQGWMGQLTVVEYLLILKLISWPILFALFARTAKQVDDEADRIWKYQLYSLATNFSLRPSLPPPLTPLFLLVINCCRLTGCIPRWLFSSSSSTDHPDVQALLASPSQKSSTVYRNPSVPSSRTRSQNRYWTHLSIMHWKSLKPHKSAATSKNIDKELNEKLKLLLLFTTTFESANEVVGTAREPDAEDSGENQWNRLKVKEENKNWTRLLPGYSPSKYSKPAGEFALEVQRNVQDDSAQNVIELGKYWRHRKFSELLSTAANSTRLPSHKSYVLSCDGLPLNPRGRTGLAGRGEYARFGPNKLYIYVMFINKANNLSVLTESSGGDLPSKWRYVIARSDEFLEQLLTFIGVQDTEIQLMTSRVYLEVGQAESHLAHVASRILPSSKDTDNSWTEADVWAADLSYLSDFNLKIDGYEWKPVSGAVFSSSEYQEFVELSLQALNMKGGTTGRRK